MKIRLSLIPNVVPYNAKLIEVNSKDTITEVDLEKISALPWYKIYSDTIVYVLIALIICFPIPKILVAPIIWLIKKQMSIFICLALALICSIYYDMIYGVEKILEQSKNCMKYLFNKRIALVTVVLNIMWFELNKLSDAIVMLLMSMIGILFYQTSKPDWITSLLNSVFIYRMITGVSMILSVITLLSVPMATILFF